MKKLFLCLLLSAPGIAIPPAATAAGLQFHWQDDFSQDERRQLRAWIERTDAAMTSIVGTLPFARHIYFHRRDNASEPVPWAHTQRGSQQGVHFHVDPKFAPSAFLQDWTAPHELSHLIIPYLGEGDAWFAEGFASYMQYQVMGALGVLEPAEIADRYVHRFERAERNFGKDGDRFARLPFAGAAPSLRSKGQYPTMYWGGAIYFWQVDHWLREHADTSLSEILRDYVACCRNDTKRIDELMAALDAMAVSPVFSHCLTVFREEPGFPEFRRELKLPPSAR